MGRLLKKKPAAQKKKKKLSTTPEGDAAQGASTQSDSNGGLKLVSSKESAKKSVVGGRKTTPQAKAASGPVKSNIFTKSIQFLREVKVELKKVTWPTRKQTIGSTVVVIVLVLIISFFLGVIDIGLSSLVKLVLQ